jgi:hypothetical protein
MKKQRNQGMTGDVTMLLRDIYAHRRRREATRTSTHDLQHMAVLSFAALNGWTLFLVLTLPGITVRWLPEQEIASPSLIRPDDDEAGALVALASRKRVVCND